MSQQRQDFHDPSINDKQLITLSVRELNKHLKSSKFNKNQVQKMKQRRRTLKNRGYAASCRNKRFQKKGELEYQKREELKEIAILSDEIMKYKELISQLHERISDCLLFAKQNNIDLQYLEHQLSNQHHNQQQHSMCRWDNLTDADQEEHLQRS